MKRIAPLIARVQPIPGETLLSLVARAAHANVFPKLADLLGHAGIGGYPAFAPFTAADRAQPLAELLRVAVDEVAARFHPLHADQSLKGAVNWAGIRMRRRSIEARSRRVAPMALKISPHHRLEWTHRALTFCPESLQQLISSCPACGAGLGWVTTKGLDRCENCEVPLIEAPAPMVRTRSPERLIGAARLISPDPAVKAAAQALLPNEFHAWDAGDLFNAMCELGVAWRRPGEGRVSATARALFDGSFDFEPEDIARGYVLVREWPQRAGVLLDRLAAEASSHRTNGRLTSAHLGVLGRHLTPVATGPTLSGLLMRAVEAEAEGRRIRAVQARSARVDLDQLLRHSIGLVEACVLHGISRPVLKRLVPAGRSLIAAQSRRQGGVRFDPDALAATVEAYRTCVSFTDASRGLGAPRYCLPALIDAGVLERCPDPDVELLFAERAVTVASLSGVQRRLETMPTRRQSTLGLRSLGACLRRRFDPLVWAEALRLTLEDGRVHRLTVADDGAGQPLIDRVFVWGEMLSELLPCDDPSRIDEGASLSARETGRLLGLSSSHLPELVEAGRLQGECTSGGWSYRLGDVAAFHGRYVTSTEFRQRHAPFLGELGARPYFGDDDDATLKLDAYIDVIRTRHFQICERKDLEETYEWPETSLS